MTPEQQEAMKELSQKSLKTIQVETAMKWAHRAWAAYTMAHTLSDTKMLDQTIRWLHDAVEYEHEAIEHASLSGDDTVLHNVRLIMNSAKQ